MAWRGAGGAARPVRAAAGHRIVFTSQHLPLVIALERFYIQFMSPSLPSLLSPSSPPPLPVCPSAELSILLWFPSSDVTYALSFLGFRFSCSSCVTCEPLHYLVCWRLLLFCIGRSSGGNREICGDSGIGDSKNKEIRC